MQKALKQVVEPYTTYTAGVVEANTIYKAEPLVAMSIAQGDAGPDKGGR